VPSSVLPTRAQQPRWSRAARSGAPQGGKSRLRSRGYFKGKHQLDKGSTKEAKPNTRERNMFSPWTNALARAGRSSERGSAIGIRRPLAYGPRGIRATTLGFIHGF
jgi:hypothetical protein